MSFVAVRGGAGAVLIWQLAGPWKSAAIITAASVTLGISSIVLRRLLPGSVDAAFQAVFGSQVTILWLAPNTVKPLGLLLISFTASLSYFLSGMGKLMYWRGTTDLTALLRFPYIQNLTAADFLDVHPKLTQFAVWSIKVWETAFPISILGGPKVCAAFLFTGVLFHLANAALMGFTRVPLVLFVSYPAVYFSSLMINMHFMTVPLYLNK